ncbi:hypothetical protein T492DRAFT_968497 [Pavlovales sp. CCMP2436]|nr:hypothetical protein T492DRAFT_968497 [Pavlovales sp. CCMP2436]
MPESLDLLILSLGKALANPTDGRYKRVPLGNANFKTHVIDAPGGLALLQACGYERNGDALCLRKMDEMVLTLAISALEGARGSAHYLDAKSEMLLVSALGASKADFDVAEKARRARAAAKVPLEPTDGAAGNTLLCFHIGSRKADRVRCVWRRFESWNTLGDLFAYVDSTTPLEIGTTGALFDVTLTAPVKLEQADSGRTLQMLGLWPTGHLSIMPILAAA